MAEITVQGRRLTDEDLQAIRDLMAASPEQGRSGLSLDLVKRWNWRNGAGQLKDMSCRRMLRRLESKGFLTLPPRRTNPGKRSSRRIAPVRNLDRSSVMVSLRDLQPLTLKKIRHGTEEAKLFNGLLMEHHYLGYKYPIGANVRYLAYSRDDRPIACAVWSSAALKVGVRDAWIGWNPEQRMTGLAKIANNTRFLILPWVRVPHLASHLLGLMIRRLPSDWKSVTGNELALLETFVEEERFQGTCYRASNWLDLGRTTGRTRDDRHGTIRTPTKRVMVYAYQPQPRLRKELIP